MLYEGYFNETPECWGLFAEVQGTQNGPMWAKHHCAIAELP